MGAGTGLEVPDDWAVAVDAGVESRGLRLGAMIENSCDCVELWSLYALKLDSVVFARVRPRSRLMGPSWGGGWYREG
jgi:hypothetical protein